MNIFQEPIIYYMIIWKDSAYIPRIDKKLVYSDKKSIKHLIDLHKNISGYKKLYEWSLN